MLWGSGFTVVLKEDWGEGTGGLAPRASADIRVCLRAGATRQADRALTPEQEAALLGWTKDAAAAAAAEAWRAFRPADGLLLLEANVNLLPAAFVSYFGLDDLNSAEFLAAVADALKLAVDWYLKQETEFAAL